MLTGKRQLADYSMNHFELGCVGEYLFKYTAAKVNVERHNFRYHVIKKIFV